MQMKIALVGVGGMGTVHFNIYKGMADVEIVALCDVRTEILPEKAGDLPIRIYGDMDEMLAAEKPDMVDLCTPTYLHAEQAVKAMEAGAHVLSEKPMALTSKEAEIIKDAMARTGKRYMTAQVVRFMNAYVYLKGIIDSGKYGKLESLHLRRISQTPMWSWENWFLDESKSGHMMLDLMIHDIDYVQSVFGEPRDIVGIYHPMTDSYTNYAVASYVYDGFTVSIESGWFNDQNLRFTADFRASFKDGNIILKDGKLYENNEVVDLDNAEKIGESGINISNVDGYAGEIKYFIECIKSGEDCHMVTPDSAQATVKLVKRTKESLTIV